MTLKLYELSESMNQVAYMMEDGVEGLEGVLETIDVSFQQKAEGIIKLRHSKLTEAETIDNEINRLKLRADKLKKRWRMVERICRTGDAERQHARNQVGAVQNKA